MAPEVAELLPLLPVSNTNIMKKILCGLLLMAVFAACNNDADTNTKTDTVNLDVNTNNSTGDTSSYERMPNNVTDSVP